MARPEKLSDDEVRQGLEGLPGWALVDGKLHRTLKFKDFVTAFGWMTSAALVVEKLGHHPEWSNVYGTVEVDLVTHDAGGLTELDLKLARRMSALADRFGAD